MSHIQTSLAAICAARPCSEGIRKLLTTVGKTMSEAREDHTPMCLSVVLDSNGLDDALWVLDNACDAPMIRRMFAADCAESVLHLFTAVHPDDSRPADAIRAARNPDASSEDLSAARAAAGDAARAAGDAGDAGDAGATARAAWAARAAAGATAWDAARAARAAWDAARSAYAKRLRHYIDNGAAQ